jgi:type I restriction enzyme S subunit
MIRDLNPYGEYKSGPSWIGNVPSHWQVLPNRGLFTEVKERDHPDEEMLSVTITRGVIRQGTLLADSSKKDSSNLDKTAYKLVQPGDIAYNKMRAWQGAVGASVYRGIVSPAYVVMRPRDKNNSRYFHYLLRTPAFAKEAERWSYGITSDMWSLRPEHFRMIYCPCPSPEEQSAIVRFLDYADRRIRRSIRAKRKLIKLLDEQRRVIIHKAVTRGLDPNVRFKPSGIPFVLEVPAHWGMSRVRNVAHMLVSNVDKKSEDGEVRVRLCNYVDVYKNERITRSITFMTATAAQAEINRFTLRVGDVVITKDSELWNDIAVPALVEYEAPDLVCGYHLAILRPRASALSGAFLLRLLQSPMIATQFYVAANGVTRYGLSHDAIKSAILPLPPLPEQSVIVRHLDKATADTTAAIARATREISLLHEYGIRLTADLVTGKFDVREAVARLPETVEESEISEEIVPIADLENEADGQPIPEESEV